MPRQHRICYRYTALLAIWTQTNVRDRPTKKIFYCLFCIRTILPNLNKVFSLQFISKISTSQKGYIFKCVFSFILPGHLHFFQWRSQHYYCHGFEQITMIGSIHMQFLDKSFNLKIYLESKTQRGQFPPMTFTQTNRIMVHQL